MGGLEVGWLEVGWLEVGWLWSWAGSVVSVAASDLGNLSVISSFATPWGLGFGD